MKELELTEEFELTEDSVDNFSGSSDDEKSEEDCVVVPSEAGAYQGKPLANVEHTQENRVEEERDADGLTAEILETRFGRRSPVSDMLPDTLLPKGRTGPQNIIR